MIIAKGYEHASLQKTPKGWNNYISADNHVSPSGFAWRFHNNADSQL